MSTSLPTETSSSDSDDSGSMNVNPLTWLLIPFSIAVLIAVVFTVTHYRTRRRLRNTPGWPHPPGGPSPFRPLGRGGSEMLDQRRERQRMARPGVTRSEEGLNELGQAPPAYDGKKGALRDPGTELRDLEAGGASPPEYVEIPAPAVTREGREST
ncbi:hypothetical protein B0J13DRAFT_302589 [Dactylonectria estremocensis]|uniref:Uncharacterized protein n=1 Tax=Dactylonectria estremocensis TaxID=1079267 RepID=A0A9P9F0G6_9HYPO|nr:hypothetical protein B0J13DRAFT_302589 [Dactylonectria estremocensis]